MDVCEGCGTHFGTVRAASITTILAPADLEIAVVDGTEASTTHTVPRPPRQLPGTRVGGAALIGLPIS